MPIFIDEDSSAHQLFSSSDPKCLEIAFVNNMPDSALEATERQFFALLDTAADCIVVHLTLYALPDIPRTERGREHLRSYYDIGELWGAPVDGMIVTGAERRAANPAVEPYWGNLTRLIEWAEHNTYSTVWSGLAADAAVLHMDGISRRTLSSKRFGIFDCRRVQDHELTYGVPHRTRMPHSRWNEIPEGALRSCGYQILTRGEDASVDSFVKHRNSLSVFFQGHPEYEADTVLLEYVGDIKRFIRYESDTYPETPTGYFDHETLVALNAVRERALIDRREDLIADFRTVLTPNVVNSWQTTAVQIYRNWLLYMTEQKERKLKMKSFGRARAHAATR